MYKHPAVRTAARPRAPSASLDKPAASRRTAAGLLVLGHSTTSLLLLWGPVLYSIAPPQPARSDFCDFYQCCSAERNSGLGCAYTNKAGWPSSQTNLPATSWQPYTSTTSCTPTHLFRSVPGYQNLKPSLPLLIFKSCPFWNGTAKMSRGHLSVLPLPLAFCFLLFSFFFFEETALFLQSFYRENPHSRVD